MFFNADSSEPTVLWLLKCGIEDGRGNLIGERLFAIHKTDCHLPQEPAVCLA